MDFNQENHPVIRPLRETIRELNEEGLQSSVQIVEKKSVKMINETSDEASFNDYILSGSASVDLDKIEPPTVMQMIKT